MDKREKLVFGIPLKAIIRFIIVFTVFGIGTYILKFYVESEFYTLIFSVILAVTIMVIGIPKDKWKELFENKYNQ
ncbi:hypothetical protein U970_02672 [Staphylococcus aureus 56824-10]|uniref:hypothetical protein n=1 Tax=Staphylococcus aureus TaxID=1280 RepID=UPI00044FC4FB|nr:hypothetical protein [Staphylococcus aureus]EZW47934.1 hypothetical protein U970_02672 [Staphylococcus aureus 56824-10]